MPLRSVTPRPYGAVVTTVWDPGPARRPEREQAVPCQCVDPSCKMMTFERDGWATPHYEMDRALRVERMGRAKGGWITPGKARWGRRTGT